jgi:hypothetical protein
MRCGELYARVSQLASPGFQATALIFPTQGCWEVAGQVGESTLIFVTRVVKLLSWKSLCLTEPTLVNLRYRINTCNCLVTSSMGIFR